MAGHSGDDQQALFNQYKKFKDETNPIIQAFNKVVNLAKLGSRKLTFYPVIEALKNKPNLDHINGFVAHFYEKRSEDEREKNVFTRFISEVRELKKKSVAGIATEALADWLAAALDGVLFEPFFKNKPVKKKGFRKTESPMPQLQTVTRRKAAVQAERNIKSSLWTEKQDPAKLKSIEKPAKRSRLVVAPVNPPEAVVSRNDELYPDDVPLACWGNLQKIQEYRRAQEAPIEHPVAFSSRSVLSDSDAPRAVISMPTERTTLQGGEEVLETSAELEPHVDTPIHSPIVQGLSTQPYFSDADYAALGFDLYEDPTFEVNTGFDHIECECSVRPPSAVQCAAQDAGTGNLTTETRIQHIEPTLPTLGNTQFDINFPYKEGEFKQAAQDNEKKQLEVHIGHSQVGVTPDREKFFRVASVLSQELISEQPSQVNVAIPSSEPTLEIVTENTLVSESAGPALSIDTCAIDPIPHDPFKNVELSMAPVSLVCFGFDASLFEASYRQHRFEEKVREKFKDLTIPEDWLNQKAWITQNLEPKLKDMFVENFDCVELFLSLPGMSQFCGRLNREFKKEKTRRNSVLKAENSFG